MPLLILLGFLVLLIGVVIFTVNKRDSDRFIEMQTKERYDHKKEAENLNTFRNDPSGSNGEEGNE